MTKGTKPSSMSLVLVLTLSIFSLNVAYAKEENTSKPADLTEVRLLLNWKHQFQFAGYYAAIQKGFYEEVGLKVSLIENEFPVKMYDDLADFSVNNGTAIFDRAKGLPLVILAPIFQHTARIIISNANSGIQNVHDMVGKRIMMDENEPYILAYLKREGIDISQLEVVPRDYTYKSFFDGDVDATVGYLTDLPLLIERKGLDFNLINPISAGIDFYSELLTTTEKMIRTNPEIVQAMLQASIRGWEYAMLNKNEIIDVICEEYDTACDRTLLEYEANAMDRLIASELVDIGYSNKGRWDYMIKTYIDLGFLPENFNDEGLFYDDYTKNEYKLSKKYVVIALAIIIPLSLMVIFFYLINRRLRQEIKLNKELSNNLTIGEFKYKNLVENTNDILYSLDMYGRVIYVSNNAKEVLGYKLDEIIGKRIYHFVHKDDVSASLKSIKDIFYNGKKNNSIGFRIRTKEGIWKSFITTMYPVYNDSSEIIHIDGVSVDISDRIAYERQLSEAKLRAEELLKSYENIVENNSVYIVNFNQNLTLSYVNPCYADIYGVDQDEFIGKPSTLFVTDAMAKEMYRIKDLCIANPNTPFELILETTAGTGYLRTTKWEVKATSKKANGDWELLSVGFDITDQMDNLKTSAELLANSKEQNLKLQTFAFVVSHNIRSQAANMSGLLDILDFADTKEEIQSIRSLMKASSEKMDETLSHLNGLLNLEHNDNILYSSINLYQAINDSKRAWVYDESLSNREVRISVDKTINVNVVPSYLDSIFFNIYSYIKEYIDQEKKFIPIEITAKKVKNSSIKLSIQYVAKSNDLAHKGISTFNPLKSRLGNQNSLSMGMFLMHEQLVAMNIDYELKLVSKEPALAQFNLLLAIAND
jgi:PAS domain S-box-containing protein